MTPTPLPEVRRLTRAERHWLADARDRLRRTRTDRTDRPDRTDRTDRTVGAVLPAADGGAR